MSIKTDTANSKELLNLLKSGAKEYRCGTYLYNLDPIGRQQIYQTLEAERLERKHLEIHELYYYTNQDWNQVVLIRLLRYLSDEANRTNYTEIGLRINFNTILRERSSLRNLEAIFIAASGLIDTLPHDNFTNQLRQDVEYMAHKHEIIPLSEESWSRRRMTTAKEPILRLVQVARILYDSDILFNKLINCKSRNDIFNLFNVEARSEWSKYFGENRANRIGVEKCDLIGINVVVPMLYAYGSYVSDDNIVSAARDLNEILPAETNRYIKKWRSHGLTPTVSYETQALIQLSTVYCNELACERCHLYQHMHSKSSILDTIPAFTEYQR